MPQKTDPTGNDGGSICKPSEAAHEQQTADEAAWDAHCERHHKHEREAIAKAIAAERERCAKERDSLKQAILDGINCCDCKYDADGITIGPCELHDRITKLEKALKEIVDHDLPNDFSRDALVADLKYVAAQALKWGAA